VTYAFWVRSSRPTVVPPVSACASQAGAQCAQQHVPVRSRFRWLLRWLLARHCCSASMCAWTCGNAVSAWVWLIHWLLGLETTGLRKLSLGL
jgi:hypothetical protein